MTTGEAVAIHQVCERFHTAIELIGGRWTGAIIRAVFTGQHRFAHIRAAVPGLSDTMLAQRLRTLEENGLLERRAGPGGTPGPAPAEYHLTQKGLELEPVLAAVTAWSHRWVPLPGAGDPGPGPFDPATGRPLRP
ncbi:winged helix-turn-helix transcriptional regulator [Actinacidiphila guanduensis]|uniref:Transcriptional regulator, HxlR family n=1 Tax=Actinacidiphila guanduensis TaxID=310781 RepID=A0A1H0MTV1_9ACTN|nr:helix-turn-helix domain-containing protein [Actinacidiphila guanduensis]SDO83735.1 transcriptional regulator, HxlR family [Actinacidiphila guanduensis]